MTVVYRIEHKTDGVGPYIHYWDDSNRRLKFSNICNTTKTHPSLFEDKLISGIDLCSNNCLQLPDNSLFCFSSLDSLLSWFGKVLHLLHKEGFQLIVYEVDFDQLSIYKTQAVILNEERAKVLKVHDIYKYLIKGNKK